MMNSLICEMATSLIHETVTSLIIDSKHYPDQNANYLTIYLDEELRNVESMKLIYAGIPCSFYNITSEIGINEFGIEDSFLIGNI
jgi:hypothetical protein